MAILVASNVNKHEHAHLGKIISQLEMIEGHTSWAVTY